MTTLAERNYLNTTHNKSILERKECLDEMQCSLNNVKYCLKALRNFFNFFNLFISSSSFFFGGGGGGGGQGVQIIIINSQNI